LDTVGNKDLGVFEPELLHLKEGVWIIQKSMRRKLRIRNANNAWHWDPGVVSSRLVVDNGKTYQTPMSDYGGRAVGILHRPGH